MQTLSKVMGYAMVAGGAIVKVPQLLNILLQQSVYGISYPSVLLEFATNWTMTVYNWHRHNPFSIYGENVFIGLQNLIIMALFVVYARSVPKGVGVPPPSAHLQYLGCLVGVGLAIATTKEPSSWPP